MPHPYLSEPPLAIAHRGGYLAERAPGGTGQRPERPVTWEENSFRAFSRAVAMGYRYLETDVHATSDGVLIAFHDDRLDRVTDRRGRITDLRHEEVSLARIGGDLPVPTMAELLTAFAATPADRGLNEGPVRFNVDLKATSAVLPLWRLLSRHADARAGDRVCAASFSSPRLWLFRLLSLAARLRGEAAATTSAGPIGVTALRLLPAAITRWLHSPGVAYQVPVSVQVGPFSVTIVTPGFVRRAHALGKQVHVWTVNDEADMRRLLEMGVDGIVSDAIDTLARVVSERAATAPRPERPGGR